MKLLSIVVSVLIGCGPGLRDTEPQYRSPKLHDSAEKLTRASSAHDVAAVRALLRDVVTIGGLWFPDTRCMIEFAAPAEVRGPKLDELARCLATLELKRSELEDALPDVVVLTYGGGIELEARFVEHESGPWLAWIGYSARRDLQDALPTISAATLEALRIDGDPQAPLAGPGTFSELEMKHGAYAWLKVCIDASGAVTGAHVREATSPRTARTFAAATQTWKFRPYMLGSQPAPVCAMVRMAYAMKEGDREKLPLPLPDGPDTLLRVPHLVLGDRVTGTTMVAPDDIDKLALAKAGRPRLISAFYYCIDETGRVAKVVMLRSSGLPGYDRKIVAAIKRWVYRPFLDEGRPIGVCSSVHFIYSQAHGGIRMQRH